MWVSVRQSTSKLVSRKFLANSSFTSNVLFLDCDPCQPLFPPYLWISILGKRQTFSKSTLSPAGLQHRLVGNDHYVFCFMVCSRRWKVHEQHWFGPTVVSHIIKHLDHGYVNTKLFQICFLHLPNLSYLIITFCDATINTRAKNYSYLLSLT